MGSRRAVLPRMVPSGTVDLHGIIFSTFAIYIVHFGNCKKKKEHINAPMNSS